MSRVVPDEVWAILTVWQEARGEEFDGKVAVARVIRNRMLKRWSGSGDVVDTVLAPSQFSGWNTSDPNRRTSARLDDMDQHYLDCAKAWSVSAMSEGGVDDAVFYYAPASVPVPPSWAMPEKLTAIVGRHHFFRA